MASSGCIPTFGRWYEHLHQEAFARQGVNPPKASGVLLFPDKETPIQGTSGRASYIQSAWSSQSRSSSHGSVSKWKQKGNQFKYLGVSVFRLHLPTWISKRLFLLVSLQLNPQTNWTPRLKRIPSPSFQASMFLTPSHICLKAITLLRLK